MASADLQTFIQDRLRALDPTVDLSPGSPADRQVVQPILTKLGTDPMSTDVDSFLTDRLAQEMPNIYGQDPAAIREILINPLILFLEPFKREIQSIETNQSLANPDLLSDDDADALAANYFETRSSGGFSIGFGRVFYQNPANVQAEVTTRFFTGNGLNYFPTNPLSITAEEMAFNKDGNLFFFDVPLKAEKAGSEYNIDADATGTSGLVGVDGLPGAVKVTNPIAFENGSSAVDTATFISDTQQALNERSLVTRRGGTARLNDVFQTELRALQVIGAGDAEMQRDILVGASPGHAWLTGVVSVYKNIAFVQCRTVEGSLSDAPVPGDTLYLYLDFATFPGVLQTDRFVRLVVEEVLVASQTPSSTYPVQYFVRWSGAMPAGVVLPSPAVLQGGFSKKGVLKISSLPDIGPVSLSIQNQQVHVYGHTDFYVRPIVQSSSKSVFANLSDAGVFATVPGSATDSPGSLVERTTLQTYGEDATPANHNKITDTDGSFTFTGAGVQVGDLLSIETGSDAGIYPIGQVTASAIYLSSDLIKSDSGMRYRILRKLRIDPFDAKVLKLPFGAVSANDLFTEIASDLFVFAVNDLVNFGLKTGDIIRVLQGVDAGDFTVKAIVDGKHVVVDRPAGGSSSNLQYQVFTPLQSLQRPLIRVKELVLLDSTQQSTGIEVPPAEPVAVIPTCDFTSAQVRGASQRKSGFVLPALGKVASGVNTADLVNAVNVAAVSGDRRYSLGFDAPVGTYKAMLFPNAAQAEFDFHDVTDPTCHWFLATTESVVGGLGLPPIDPVPGQCLNIKNGPNVGSYLIRQVYKFKYDLSDGTPVWAYFIQIHGTFPFDPLKDLIQFLDKAQTDGAGSVSLTRITNVSGTITFPDFFVNSYNGIGAKLDTAITFYGVTSPGASALQAMVDSQSSTTYDWGDPARGTIRMYFTDPTLFEEWTGTGSLVTLFDYKTAAGGAVQFRPDPATYLNYEVVPPRLLADASPTDYPRDFDGSVPSQVTFTDTAKASVFVVGVQPQDEVEYHPEIFFHGSNKSHQTAVITQAGSNIVTAPTASSNPFTTAMIGNLIFIDQGADAGGYVVTDVPNTHTLVLDRPLSVTTPTIVIQGSGANWGYNGSVDKLHVAAPTFNSGHLNLYLTLYGMDYTYQGSFKILSIIDSQTVSLDRTLPAGIGHFPTYDASGAHGTAFWVITAAPPDLTTITAVGASASTLWGLQPVRMYSEVPLELPITSVTPSPDSSVVAVTGTPVDGFKQPYHIVRPNIRRVTPSEMELSQDGSLFFIDTEVVSLSPEPAANIVEGSYLTLEPGTYRAFGYRHVVADNTLSFSTKETGFLDLPTRILPLGIADSQDAFLDIVGAPLQVSYEQSSLVQQVQDFINSAEDRVTAANMLARHFLPAYVSYDATYAGGSQPSVVAQDIIDYINTISIETPLEISKLQDLITKRGGDPETPTKVMQLLHDWDRKRWAEFSENKLGGTLTKVPYNGTPRVSYFIAGPDVSGQATIPTGERVNLVRE